MTATSEAPSNDDADLPLGGVVEEIEAGTKKPGLVKSMPWLVRIAAVWLLLVFIAAASTTIFGWFGRDAPFLTDPNYNHFIFEGKEANQGPSGEFWLGTDKLARDIFSRIVAGAKVSITVALTAVAFGIVFGGMLGSLVGLVRGRTETVIMSLVDGKRTVEEMASVLEHQKLMSKQEAVPAIRTFLTKMYDDAQRQPGFQ